MKSASVTLLLLAANLVAAFACTIEQELATLQALKQMKECKRSALYTSLKPLKECKAILPSLELPKLKQVVGKWDQMWDKWGKWGKCGGKWGGKGCEAAGAPLIFLLPSPQLQAPAPTCPSVAAPPPPPVLLAPPPPAAAFLTAPPAFLQAPPPAYAAPYQYAAPQAPVYRRLVTELPPAPAERPTCEAPHQQLFYKPQTDSGSAPSPLLFLSNSKCACSQ